MCCKCAALCAKKLIIDANALRRPGTKISARGWARCRRWCAPPAAASSWFRASASCATPGAWELPRCQLSFETSACMLLLLRSCRKDSNCAPTPLPSSVGKTAVAAACTQFAVCLSGGWHASRLLHGSMVGNFTEWKSHDGGCMLFAGRSMCTCATGLWPRRWTGQPAGASSSTCGLRSSARQR